MLINDSQSRIEFQSSVFLKMKNERLRNKQKELSYKKLYFGAFLFYHFTLY